jgi:hypothetical protein
MTVNGGFPPINIKNKSKDKSKDKNKAKSNNINLKIKNILSESNVKPMIEFDKPKIEVINDL